MLSMWVPSTWQGTGQHNKEQRLGLRKYGSHFSPPDNAPWGRIFAGRLLSVSLARYPLADVAPRVYVYTGWHDPYSSLSSQLESKYHIQNHPTSPTLVGMLKGSGAQMAYRWRRSNVVLSVSVKKFLIIHVLLMWCIARRHEAWRGSK